MMDRLRTWLQQPEHRWELVAVLVCVVWAWAQLVVPALQNAASNGAGIGAFLGTAEQHWVIGAGIDLIGTLWTFDFAWGVMGGENGTDSEALFVPVGFDVGSAQGFAWLDAVVSSPLGLLLGMPGFYNAHVLFTLASTLVAMHLALRGNQAHPALAVAMATVFACGPFVLMEVLEGRPTQAYLWPHAVFLGLAWRLTRPGGNPVVLGIGAGVALAGACLTYWFSGIAMGITAGIAVVGCLFTLPALRRRIVTGGAALTATALALAAAPAWPMVSQMREKSGADWMGQSAKPTTAEVFGIELEFTTLGVRRYDGFDEFVRGIFDTGLPPVLVALALLSLAGLGRSWRRQLPWVVASLLTLTLPLEPLFAFNEGDPYPTFKGLLEFVFPPITRCHQPNRMVVGTMAAFAMVTATGAGAALDRLGPLKERVAWGTGLVVLVGAWLSPAIVHDGAGRSTEVLEASAFYEGLRTWPGGVIDVPLSESTEEYVYQVVHRRPVLGGPAYGSEKVHPAEHQALIRTNSYIQALDQLCQQGTMPSWHPAHLQALHDWGMGVVVVHGRRCRVEASTWQQVLGAQGLQGKGRRLGFKLPAAQ